MSNVIRAMLCLLVVQAAMIPSLPTISGSGADVPWESITAHRGSSETAPENTLSAFRQAIRAGAGYAELDVQETADGVVMLMHDDTAKRTTGIDKPMWQVTSAELAAASAGSWFGERFDGERVPTLERVIDTVNGRMKLNIELKNNGHQVKLAERAVEVVKRKKFEKDCIFTSFDAKLLHQVKQLDPKLRTGLIVDKAGGEGFWEKLLSSPDYDALSLAYPLAEPELLKLAAKHNKDILVWTVNDPTMMRKLLDLGVTSVITDKPKLLAQIVGEQLAERKGISGTAK
ncbi:glycerophosphoryl diester phosphodiesterase [Paenibacillus sp. UNCCL117]|uniref:glycerophosphodiester phosphodiesterase n=1 Tax=unclassified Paenibacillus TaxID=185978 RepID=UPI000880146B|nr:MULTISPECIES: glycerophosphodiester phosphodiesterase family protein [unclassified Paenibacillus]SDD70681.1 glycerophosphoryl diester phosphodiesterase [Paenibacillus sp. cl123]SFW45391.1 glycerophosphoryl diester phosphodiesterase [Paenibacillus sp. UNCCL117]